MKKAINITSILIIVLLVAQVVCLFLPYWNMTPIANLLHDDPQPTDYSIMDYCWFNVSTMTSILRPQFLADYGVTYKVNDYAVGLAMTTLFCMLALGISGIKLYKDLSASKAYITTILCHVISIAWAYFALEYFTNFVLTLATYPIVHTLLIIFSVCVIPVMAVRLVLDVIVAVKAYRAEYCA